MSDVIELLNEKIQLIELVNDASIDCIMVFDTHFDAIYWNKTSEIVTALSKATAIGRNFFHLFPYFSDCKEIRNALDQALKGRKSFIPYEKGSYPEGYHEHHFVPLKNHTGAVVGILNIVHDVAHRIKVENELKSLNRSLVRKNKELKNKNDELLAFAHVASYDLKEPLHKIYSFAEMIQQRDADNLSEAGKNNFKRIQAAAQRMRLLTDDITKYCNIKADASVSEINLNHLVLLIVSNMQDEIRKKGATIETSDLPTIKGYRLQLLTLFQNIIGNALKFQLNSATPEIKIMAGVLSGEEILHPDALADKQYVRISIADNGVGFDQRNAERIFQMFYRIDLQAYPGSGIGLAVCKKIAELHHGFITADSEENKGSVFNVFLPLSKAR